MMSKLKIFILIATICFTMKASAAIKLPAVLADHMVLQQKSNVPLWGQAKANAVISIKTSWNKKVYQAKADPQGKWRQMVQTPTAGGPYTITFSDGTPLELTDILIGEVWVCSGQSNMEMPMRGFKSIPILNSNDLLAKAENQNLRLFQIQHAVAASPQDDCLGNWKVSSSENALMFSAIGFQFGLMLEQALKVPVGIIESDWGGTPIEAWMPAKNIADFSSIKLPAADQKMYSGTPTALFNGMIAPIAGFGIQGFLWYQGEANTRKPGNYDKKMKSMVEGWRENWKRDTIPFYYVQIAPYKYPNVPDSIPYLREKQQLAQQQIPNSGMVVSIDAGDELNIHPSDKSTISKRLFYWALGHTYNRKGLAYQSPIYQGMNITGNQVILDFKNTPQGFTSYRQDITGFEIAGADKVFYPATAKIFNNTIYVTSTQVSKPVAVRYAFKDFGVGNLYNTFGLPVAPFRSDNW
jgi:sialate O-acetylesterase